MRKPRHLIMRPEPLANEFPESQFGYLCCDSGPEPTTGLMLTLSVFSENTRINHVTILPRGTL